MGIINDGRQAKYLRMVRITAMNASTFYSGVPSGAQPVHRVMRFLGVRLLNNVSRPVAQRI